MWYFVLGTFCIVFLIENIYLVFRFRLVISNKIKNILNKKKNPDASIKFIDQAGKWYISQDHKPLLIMHGAAGTGHRYSNSKEGIIDSIKKGFSVIEIDIGITSDNYLVLTHRFMPDDEICFEKTPSLADFLKKGAPCGETALSLSDFFECFSDSPVYFILDCAHGIEEKTCRWIKDNIQPERRKHIIFQVHTQSILMKIYNMGVFEYLHYNGNCRDVLDSLSLLKECNIHTCSIADEELVSSNTDLCKVVNSGLHVFAYTINHKRRLESIIPLGVSGVFTDCLTLSDIVSINN